MMTYDMHFGFYEAQMTNQMTQINTFKSETLGLHGPCHRYGTSLGVSASCAARSEPSRSTCAISSHAALSRLTCSRAQPLRDGERLLAEREPGETNVTSGVHVTRHSQRDELQDDHGGDDPHVEDDGVVRDHHAPDGGPLQARPRLSPSPGLAG